MGPAPRAQGTGIMERSDSSTDRRERSLHFTRRGLLKTGVLAGAAAALPIAWVVSADQAALLPDSKLPRPFTTPFGKPAPVVPVRSDATTDYYRIEMTAVQAEIIPGFKTLLYAYGGQVPGPTITATRGRPAVVRFVNNLPPKHPVLGYVSSTSVHLHGSASLPQYDGYASDLTFPTFYKDYHYPNRQDGRTLWYHDHAHEHTAENVYSGLAGLYLLRDTLESTLPIPQGDYDVPLVIGDALFRADGNLFFSLNDDNGQWGNVILVNGRPWPVMKVARRKYRFRVIAATTSRSFQFSLSSGRSFQVIGTDGGLMPAPQTVTAYRQLGGERYEIVIDFAEYRPGERVVLKNSLGGINETFANTDKIMAFDVTDDPFDPSNNSVPAVLNPNSDAMTAQESQAVAHRSMELRRQNGHWTMNGHTWHQIVATDYQFVEWQPRDGTVETWTVKNSSGGWFHPFHTHLTDFRVLSRNGQPPRAWERGPKDVFYLGENEEVKILLHFDGAGKYMMHCHNTIHEDHDMMTQYEVISDHQAEFSPFDAPAKPQTSEPGDPL